MENDIGHRVGTSVSLHDEIKGDKDQTKNVSLK